jgi:hypothetical protein
VLASRVLGCVFGDEFVWVCGVILRWLVSIENIDPSCFVRFVCAFCSFLFLFVYSNYSFCQF